MNHKRYALNSSFVSLDVSNFRMSSSPRQWGYHPNHKDQTHCNIVSSIRLALLELSGIFLVRQGRKLREVKEKKVVIDLVCICDGHACSEDRLLAIGEETRCDEKGSITKSTRPHVRLKNGTTTCSCLRLDMWFSFF